MRRRGLPLVLLYLACLPMHAEANATQAPVLVKQPTFTARRYSRALVVALERRHLVLSTSTVNGGESDRVTHLVNLQSMEESGNAKQFDERLRLGSDAYHEKVAVELGLKPGQTAMMGTAANLGNLVHVERSFRDLRVDVFATAGVRGNAVRAGDPARWFQTEEGTRHVPESGTINILLLVNRPMRPGALAKSASVLVEAKSAALAELAVASRVSAHLATGTGTDQFIVAAPLDPEVVPLESGSQHLKIGELVGDAVSSAVKQSVAWQNDLTPTATRDVLHALGRFGLTREVVEGGLTAHLSSDVGADATSNVGSLLSEPRLVAVAFGYAAVLDRLSYGTLNPLLAQEALRDQAASAAVAVSQRPDLWPEFWGALRPDVEDPGSAFVHAMALGFAAKWDES